MSRELSLFDWIFIYKLVPPDIKIPFIDGQMIVDRTNGNVYLRMNGAWLSVSKDGNERLIK